jgi:excisionase family DNA binding protein
MEAILLNIPDAALLLGISSKCMWKWVYEGRIGSVKIGRSRKIKRSEIDRFISANEVPAKLAAEVGAM